MINPEGVERRATGAFVQPFQGCVVALGFDPGLPLARQPWALEFNPFRVESTDNNER